jgi:hypothetical protein
VKKLPRPNWTKIREQLWTRCDGLCEVSGTPLDFDTFDAHHRRNKGMGGDRRPDRDALSNLLAVEPSIHNGGPHSIHGNRPWAESLGFLIPKEQPGVAADVPVLIRARWWMRLDDCGHYFLIKDSRG